MTRAKFTPREWWIKLINYAAVLPQNRVAQAYDKQMLERVQDCDENFALSQYVHVREVLPATECEADALSETLLALENYDNVFAGFEPDDKASRFEMRRAVILAREVLAKHKALLAKAKGRAE